ncbi:MAG: serpin family protein [Acidimicrobiia bacterium]
MTQTKGPTRGVRRLVIRAAPVVVGAGLLAVACGSDTGVSGALVNANVARDQVPADQATAAAVASNALAADLYRTLAATDGNLVFSPYSIELALAMTRNGANGETRAQMGKVLHADADDLNRSLNALDAALAGRNGEKGSNARKGTVALENANALWGQKDSTFKRAFLAELARDYGAGMQIADYKKDPEAARQLINDWAAARTHDKITNLIGPGVLDHTTRLVLTNAIYFKAPWAEKYASRGDKPFTKADGSMVSVPTMDGGEGGSYGEGPGWKAAALPYLGNELSMVVIVPDDLKSFEGSLDGATLAAITGGLHDFLIGARLPKFTFRTRVSLKDQLSALGMPLAFSDGADFSGISTEEKLQIAAVVHQAFIAVDEEGTEAAAATAVVGRTLSRRMGKALLVDRPFLFAIRDNQTGAVLFLGRVTDPASKGD